MIYNNKGRGQATSQQEEMVKAIQWTITQSLKIMLIDLQGMRWFSQYIKQKKMTQKFEQDRAIFIMKNDYRYRKKKRSWGYLPKCWVTISVWGPGWLLHTSICLLAFSEIAIINRNYRLTLEKANVISSAALTMELLCIFESGTWPYP